MKRSIFAYILSLCLIIGLLPALSGCSSSEYDSLPDTYNAETDYPQTFYRSSAGPFITPSDSGYYFIAGSFIYYMDKTDMKPIVLCGRPECKHDKETDPEKIWQCNGYLSGASFIQLYEGNIYTAGNDIADPTMHSTALYQISLDGKSRKKIKAVNADASVQMSAIHRNSFYQYYSDANSRYHLKRTSLDTDAPAEEIYVSPENTVLSELYFYGKHIYLSGWYPDEDHVCRGHIEEYDIESGSVTTLLVNEADENHYSICGVDNGKIYFQYYQLVEGASVDPSQIFAYDLKTKEQSLIGTIPNEPGTYPTLLRSTEDWLVSQEGNINNGDYRDLTRMLLLLDDNFEVKQELSLSYLPERFFIAAGDVGYSFIWYWDDTYSYCLDAVDKQNGCTVKNILKKTFEELNPYISVPK